MDISIIIPTLNAEHEIEALLIALDRQSIQPNEILVVDSESEDKTIELVQKHKRVRLLEIDRQDFNHGTTRDMALNESSGDFVCFLTQDAVPVSDDYLKRLVAPMVEDSNIALVSGRQLPKADARRFEQLHVVLTILTHHPCVRKAISKNLALRRFLHLTPVLPIDGPHISNAADSIMLIPTRTCSWPPSLSPRV